MEFSRQAMSVVFIGHLVSAVWRREEEEERRRTLDIKSNNPTLKGGGI